VAGTIESTNIEIRDIESIAEMHDVETMQVVVWGCDEREVVPMTLLVAAIEVGAVLIGAFDNQKLVGFVFGFPGYENDIAVHHSHMLAVLPSHRNYNLGYRLKLAQRDRVIQQGIEHITWTFDPLQSLNAYFNFSKLGVVSNNYKINFYGEVTSSFLHQSGTDRLWVSWDINSERVRSRIETGSPDEREMERSESGFSLVSIGAEDTPQLNESHAVFKQPTLSIDIPYDVNSLQNRSAKSALAWREVTRDAFTKAISSGFVVKEFLRVVEKEGRVGRYLLNRLPSPQVR